MVQVFEYAFPCFTQHMMCKFSLWLSIIYHQL